MRSCGSIRLPISINWLEVDAYGGRNSQRQGFDVGSADGTKIITLGTVHADDRYLRLRYSPFSNAGMSLSLRDF